MLRRHFFIRSLSGPKSFERWGAASSGKGQSPAGKNFLAEKRRGRWARPFEWGRSLRGSRRLDTGSRTRCSGQRESSKNGANEGKRKFSSWPRKSSSRRYCQKNQCFSTISGLWEKQMILFSPHQFRKIRHTFLVQLVRFATFPLINLAQPLHRFLTFFRSLTPVTGKPRSCLVNLAE